MATKKTPKTAPAAGYPDGLQSGWYGLRVEAAFSQLAEVRTWARQWATAELVRYIDDDIDLLDTLDSGGGFVDLTDGRLLVIDKLPDGSAVCMGTHKSARSESAGEAFELAAALGLVRGASMVVRYCFALPDGVKPDPPKPATRH